jgi:hypothetical protein
MDHIVGGVNLPRQDAALYLPPKPGDRGTDPLQQLRQSPATDPHGVFLSSIKMTGSQWMCREEAMRTLLQRDHQKHLLSFQWDKGLPPHAGPAQWCQVQSQPPETLSREGKGVTLHWGQH